MVTFAMKLQSPDYDGVNGFQIPLPCFTDNYQGDSMAAILALFDGENQIMDFRQLREIITLTGVITELAATDAGYTNPVQMRDEMRRIRAAAANYGKNATATVKSWLSEGSSSVPFSSANWGTASLPADEQDAATTRKEGTIRLVWDQYWNPFTASYKKLFLYGTVSNIAFGPRAGASTQSRIPFSIQFLVGFVEVGT